MFNISYRDQKSNHKPSQAISDSYMKSSKEASRIEYFCRSDGKEVKICWAEGRPIQAAVKASLKDFVKIPRELLPTELLNIHGSSQFLNFLKDAHVHLTHLSDGSLKLNINQRLRGGMITDNDQPSESPLSQGGPIETLIPDPNPIDELPKGIIHTPFSCSSSSSPSASASSEPVTTSSRSIDESSPPFEDTPFKNEFMQLYESVSDLVNPFLAQEILDAIGVIRVTRLISTTNGFLPLIDSVLLSSFPSEIETSIRALDKAWIESSRGCSANVRQNRVDQLKRDFEHFINLEDSIRKGIQSCWTPLDIFFKIPIIKRFDNPLMKAVKRTIDQKDIQTLRSQIETKLEETNVNLTILNKSLKQNKDCKALNISALYTLLSQIIKKRPSEENDLSAYWNKDTQFFKDKTLYLNDLEKEKLIIGNILHCKRPEENQLSFILPGGLEVQISKNSSDFSVILIESQRYRLSDALRRSTVVQGDEFEIPHQTNNYATRPLEPGHYKLLSSTTKKVDRGTWRDLGAGFQLLFGGAAKVVSGAFLAPISAQIGSRIDQAFSLRELEPTVRQFELQNLDNQKNYTISLYYTSLSPGSLKHSDVTGITVREEGGKELLTHNHELNTLDLIKKVSNKFVINDIRTQIKFIHEFDRHAHKLYLSKEIQSKKEKLQQKLSKEEHAPFLESLIFNWISNSFKTINLDLSGSKILGLENFIEEIIQLHKEVGEGSHQSKSNILQEIIENVNYSLIVRKTEDLTVARAMQLLRTAETHIKKMENRDLVLIMGNTGAGKSTSVSYFLGAKLQKGTNSVGDQILEVKKKSRDGKTNAFPKIGFSIGTSETLHTQGYEVPIKVTRKPLRTILVDCPGFNDTREREYKLCTSMSIDRTIKKAANIKSIVLIIPFMSFLMDRGTPVIDLISEIREMFPGFFSAEHPEFSQCVHILYTKGSQCQKNSVDGIKSGKRISTLIDEDERRLKDRQDQGITVSDEIQSINDRLNIWKTLQNLQNREQITELDHEETAERVELLKKYSNSPSTIDKSSYLSLMQRNGMDQELGKVIQMSAHTWSNAIFGQFLKLQSAIEKGESKIENSKIALLREKAKIVDKERHIVEKTSERPQLTDAIQEIEAAIQNQELSITSQTPEELIAMIEKAKEDAVSSLKSELADIERSVIDQKENLQLIDIEILMTQENIANLEENIRIKRRKIEELANGYHWEEIMHVHYEPNQSIETRLISKEDVEQSFTRLEDVPASQILPGEMNTSTYRGMLIHQFTIERTFQLLPGDESSQEETERLQREFEQISVQRRVEGFSLNRLFMRERREVTRSATIIGRFTAEIDGFRYGFHLGRKAHVSGRSVTYSMQTHWKDTADGRLPWFRVRHRIPNADFNQALIANTANDIRMQTDEITRSLGELGGVDGQGGLHRSKQRIQKNINDLERRKEELGRSIQDLEQSAFLGTLQEFLRIQKARLEMIEQQIIDLKDSSLTETNIEHYTKEITEQTELLALNQQKRRNIAIIIYRQYETASLIREFSQFIINDEQQEHREAKKLNEIEEQCSAFVRLFDEKGPQLFEEAKNLLGLGEINSLGFAPLSASSCTSASSSSYTLSTHDQFHSPRSSTASSSGWP